MKTGPQKEAWIGDWLFVHNVILRWLQGGWGFDFMADRIWDLYSWRLTKREFEFCHRHYDELVSFGKKRQTLLRHLKIKTWKFGADRDALLQSNECDPEAVSLGDH